ncbi:hypothetical protein [Roseibium aggregatum]|uniref:Dyp-type peroxidase family n=1 Tax=Roseibium aggregatum TaxID=187304 RepID=A0A939EFE4_9HYPH|nr:hypothetical protein [Roseibium aggregatum]MBN9671854.1 hypothetical protein [Roseibium aggregatum]
MKPDPKNVQSLFIARYRHKFRVVLLFRIDDPATAQGFLQRWAANVNGGLSPAGSYAADVEAQLDPVCHFAFNWPGISLLLKERAATAQGLDPDEVGTNLEQFFTEEDHAPNSNSVVASLDMKGMNAPENWWTAGADQSAFHIAMLCYFADAAQKFQGLGKIRADAEASGLEEWQFPDFDDKALSGEVPAGGILHFGFRDGISKVDIDWEETGTPGKSDFRELLLGYPSSDYRISPVDPGPWNDFVRDGTYLNLAWLYQDVAAFNRFLRDHRNVTAPLSGQADPEEWLAAKMMGRWRDGSALALHPERMPEPWDPSNNFGYRSDPEGERTPLHSHIRVCNPRDQGLTHVNDRRFPKGPPRLIRRGFSYGPPLEGTEDDGKDRGLVGLFACARINEQFYSVVRWIQKTDFSDHFDTIRRGRKRQDMMFGFRGKRQAEATTYIPAGSAGAAPLELPLKDFIRYKGIAVFFAPSVKSLKYLSGS